jgi:hypothetical protein
MIRFLSVKRWLIRFLWIVLFAPAAHADTGFQALRLGFDARSGAMGMAGAALAEGASALFWNPAGLMNRIGGDGVFSMNRWIFDVKSGSFGLAWTGRNRGLGLHVLYADAGGIESRVVPSAEPIGTFSWNAFDAGLSIAGKNGAWSAGLTAKILYEKLFIDDAWGFAVDVGLRFQVRENGLRLGAALVNAGRMSGLRSEASELPLAAALGAFWPFRIGGVVCAPSLNAVFEKREPVHLQGGIECGLVRVLYLRSGFQTGYDNRTFTYGAGVVWKQVRLDYGLMPFGSGLGDSQLLTFGIQW